MHVLLSRHPDQPQPTGFPETALTLTAVATAKQSRVPSPPLAPALVWISRREMDVFQTQDAHQPSTNVPNLAIRSALAQPIRACTYENTHTHTHTCQTTPRRLCVCTRRFYTLQQSDIPARRATSSLLLKRTCRRRRLPPCSQRRRRAPACPCCGAPAPPRASRSLAVAPAPCAHRLTWRAGSSALPPPPPPQLHLEKAQRSRRCCKTRSSRRRFTPSKQTRTHGRPSACTPPPPPLQQPPHHQMASNSRSSRRCAPRTS